MNKEAIRNEFRSQSSFLKEKYHIKNIGIFGSVARNEETPKSDIDILVEFDAPIGFFDFIRLEDFLSKLLNKKVDLVSKKALKPAIKEAILNEVIYA